MPKSFIYRGLLCSKGAGSARQLRWTHHACDPQLLSGQNARRSLGHRRKAKAQWRSKQMKRTSSLLLTGGG